MPVLPQSAFLHVPFAGHRVWAGARGRPRGQSQVSWGQGQEETGGTYTGEIKSCQEVRGKEFREDREVKAKRLRTCGISARNGNRKQKARQD